jgi:GLPGLI family protein
MKKINLIFLLTFFGLFAQKNINVTYGLELTIDEDMQRKIDNRSLGDFLINSLNRELDVSEDLVFSLIIKDTISRFYLSEIKDSYKNNVENEFLFFSSYIGELYYYQDKVFQYAKYENLYTFSDFDSNWQISNESKNINGYLCYKATNLKIVVNPKGTFKFPVVAWFCPELPYHLGPIGFCGLPGLIVQLKYKTATYSMKKINFDDKTILNLNQFNKVSKISVEEHDKRSIEKFKDIITKD